MNRWRKSLLPVALAAVRAAMCSVAEASPVEVYGSEPAAAFTLCRGAVSSTPLLAGRLHRDLSRCLGVSRRNAPTARFVMFERGGHYPPIDEGERLLRGLSDFASPWERKWSGGLDTALGGGTALGVALAGSALGDLATSVEAPAPAVLAAAAPVPPAPPTAAVALPSLRLGALLQGRAELSRRDGDGRPQMELFTRRARLSASGEIHPNLRYFVQVDTSNLGKQGAGGKVGPSIILHDAMAEWTRENVSVSGGLVIVPFCRGCLQRAGELLAVDYASYLFQAAEATGSVGNRDTGVVARGYLLGQRLELRGGVFAGRTAPQGAAGLRSAGRVQYSFGEPETSATYPATYLGKRNVLAVGAGWDHQRDFTAVNADAFLDRPLAHGSVTALLNVLWWDGGHTFTAVPRQSGVLAEAGYYHAASRLQPFVRYEATHLADEGAGGDERRAQVGLTRYAIGKTLNLRGALTRIIRQRSSPTNMLTLQFQVAAD